MSILYDNDFSTYAPGQNPPYGSLENVSVVTPTIGNTIPGIYGDSQYVVMPALKALIYPHINPSSSLPAFAALSVFMGFRENPTGADQEGTLLAVNNNLTPFAGGTLLTWSINNDGTFSLTSDQGGDKKTTDFSLLQDKWAFLQLTALFSTAGGKVVMAVNLGVNGINVASAVLVSNRNASDFPTLYWNNLIIGGAGGGSFLGRVTIYDSIQSIGNNPHSASPEARISQGIIELIRLPGTGPIPTGGSQIYEA